MREKLEQKYAAAQKFSCAQKAPFGETGFFQPLNFRPAMFK
jgi:hypothetical protein